jgi:hypothetical protein
MQKEQKEQILPKNMVREVSNQLSPFLKKTIGTYYLIIHNLIALFGCFVFLFSNNIIYLSIVLNMIILDCMSIVFLHDCPLTMLEKRYLNTSMVEERQKTLKKMGIVYECTHEYETQLELLINVWSFIALKIFFIIIMNMTNIKLL